METDPARYRVLSANFRAEHRPVGVPPEPPLREVFLAAEAPNRSLRRLSEPRSGRILFLHEVVLVLRRSESLIQRHLGAQQRHADGYSPRCRGVETHTRHVSLRAFRPSMDPGARHSLIFSESRCI